MRPGCGQRRTRVPPPRFHRCVSPFLSILFLPSPLPKPREHLKAHDDRTPGDSDDDDTKAVQVHCCLTLFYLISDSHCPSISPLPDAHHTLSHASPGTSATTCATTMCNDTPCEPTRIRERGMFRRWEYACKWMTIELCSVLV